MQPVDQPAEPTQEPQRLPDVLDRLMAEVVSRAEKLPSGSYTTKLIQGGVPAMGAKIIEEAAEVVEAAEKAAAPDDNEHLIYEACDLIYHLWVLLGSRGIGVDCLRKELQRREGTSGLAEKRQRTSPPTH